MEISDLHFELHVRDLAAAKRFYVDQLGLPVLQQSEAMNLLAVRVGRSRMSIFGDRKDAEGAGHSQIILAVTDIEQAARELDSRGLTLSGPPMTAGSFLRFVTVLDPDGNIVAISEYLRDPVAPV